LAAFQRGEIDGVQAALNITLRGFLPLAVLAALLLGVAWRWGRLYCGWLCPHFSVVELLNAALSRACGKHSIWDRQRRPGFKTAPVWWGIWAASAVAMAFLWAVSLLTYLLPPTEVWGNLVSLSSTPRQAAFIGAATFVFSVDFLFARHLFCRFGCAVGVFQSLAWMSNRKAQLVSFDNRHAAACKSCDNACDHACPMRLKPRSLKRRMFNCTQCLQCVSACEQDCAGRASPPLTWRPGDGRVTPIIDARSLVQTPPKDS
jgi:polyferredoxin